MSSLSKKSGLIATAVTGLLAAAALFAVAVTFPQKTSEKSIRASTEKGRLIVIIDAGHGGEDGGAVSLSGLKESKINLDIAKRLDLILGFFGTKVVMTRDSEDLEYSKDSATIRQKKAEDQNRRLTLINSTENAILLSIHQNTYPGGAPFGPQVLYAPTKGSKEFGEAMQLALTSTLSAKNRRAASEIPDSILLLNHIKCPALLIECGFLSNAAEEKLLSTDSYQLKVASVIATGYLNNERSLSDLYFGGTNENKNNVFLHGVRQ